MQRIDGSSVRGGTIDGKILRPGAVAAICPSCNEKVVFNLGSYSAPGPQNSITASGTCPSCSKVAGFWTLNPNNSERFERAEIYMSPSSREYLPAPEEIENIPPLLRNALVSTIDCYNAGIYTATTVQGRRTLEGIFKYLLPEEKRNVPLAKLIDSVKAEIDLSAPLSSLSHAIRAGGNIGAHFDMEHEPDEKIARQIVELLSYLVSYLYVLPKKIKKLEDDLSKAEPKEIS